MVGGGSSSILIPHMLMAGVLVVQQRSVSGRAYFSGAGSAEYVHKRGWGVGVPTTRWEEGGGSVGCFNFGGVSYGRDG